MAVLSYRAKRFVRRNLSWSNIRFQWVIIGLGVFAFANLIAYPTPIFGKLPLLILGGVLTAQFWSAALFFPYPTDYPWAVRKYDDLKDWWTKVSQPARVGAFEGKSVLERWVYNDFRYIYDHTGRLIATEQTINWSDTDPNWRIGDPDDIQIIVTRVESGGERLLWLARLRSPKLPAGIRAEVIDCNGNLAGYTTYNEH